MQVWDEDGQDDTLLATGLTDVDGRYSFCIDPFTDGPSDRADVYLRFISENDLWRVQVDGSPLSFTTSTDVDVALGTVDRGVETIDDDTLQPGLEVYDATYSTWQVIPKTNNHNNCWDQEDLGGACRRVVINWAPDSTEGNFYHNFSNQIYLQASAGRSRWTVAHEVGHAVMDDLYEDDFPDTTNCDSHFVDRISSEGCAWVEGFADWIGSQATENTNYNLWDLESRSWATSGWDDGPMVEGRVAGALWDIADSANEGPWDRYGEGLENIWYTLTHHVSDTFAEFWSHRILDGFNGTSSGALGAVYQNTIDYNFRDPLGNNLPLSRPTPIPSHNFAYSTSTPYWSVVAVRPSDGSKSLYLYDDHAQDTLLANSFGDGVRFIAVDSGRRPLGSYYPRVSQATGAVVANAYDIELAQGAAILPAGASTISMDAGKVVAVRDVNLLAGVSTTISVTPGVGSQDVELHVFSSDPAISSTWIRARGTALAASTGGGPGATETVTFTPPRTGYYGVVLINKAGSGTYTITTSSSNTSPTVPNVIGSSEATARNTIAAAGFTVGSVTTVHNSAPAGSVVGQSPAGSTSAAPKTVVNLTLADGMVQVPSIFGQTLSTASDTLAAVGLRLGNETSKTTNDCDIVGTIGTQNPIAGTWVNPGTAISFTKWVLQPGARCQQSPPTPTPHVDDR